MAVFWMPPTASWAREPVEVTDNRTTAATSHATVSFGDSWLDSWVVVLATHGNTASNPGHSPTATIGGIAATRTVARSIGTGSGTAIGSAMFVAQPSGISGTVAVSWAGLATSIIVLRVSGYNCGSAHATDFSNDLIDPMPMSLNIPQSGLLLGFASRGVASELSWAGVTERGSDSTDSAGKRRTVGWDIGMLAETARAVSVSPWTATSENGVNVAVVASFSRS